MDFEVMASRLALITEVFTPTRRYRNRIVGVEAESVTVISERTNHERTIPFQHILQRSTMHGCIIDSFRQILGLGN